MVKKILVVDDSASLRQVVGIALKGGAIHIAHAPSMGHENFVQF